MAARFVPGRRRVAGAATPALQGRLLGNSNAIHWQRFGGLADHFHVSLSSHLLGIVKPDAACFARALRECDVDATATAFFDDSFINVEAARKFGMRAFHVNGLSELRRALIAEGWL